MMPVYVGIGAVRIQTWLLRMPRLRLMRGGSDRLSTTTSESSVHTRLLSLGRQDIAVAVDEAGDIDGVVALRGFTSLDDAADVANRLLMRFARDLPGAEWEAWWCEAPDYPTAASMKERPGIGDTVGRLSWLPAATEFTLAQPCVCRREPRTAEITDFDDGQPVKLGVGPDCRARFDTFYRLGPTAEPIDPCDPIENDLTGEPGHRWPRDFDELARLGGLGAASTGGLGRRDSRNHLATVVADGNAMGNLFDQLRGAPRDVPVGPLAAALSAAVDAACHAAVAAAAKGVCEPDAAVMVAIPHFVGGDDIFVTVPAPVAWRYVDVLVHEFSHHLGQFVATAEALMGNTEWARAFRAKVETTSISVGMCFARSRHPVSECHERAEAALHEAKSAGHGQHAAVGWQDLTADVTSRPHVILAGTLHDQIMASDNGDTTKLPDVFTLSPAGRSTLRDHLRELRGTGALANEIDRWASRVGWSRVGLRTDHEHLPAELSRARWWPSLREEGEA